MAATIYEPPEPNYPPVVPRGLARRRVVRLVLAACLPEDLKRDINCCSAANCMTRATSVFLYLAELGVTANACVADPKRAGFAVVREPLGDSLVLNSAIWDTPPGANRGGEGFDRPGVTHRQFATPAPEPRLDV